MTNHPNNPNPVPDPNPDPDPDPNPVPDPNPHANPNLASLDPNPHANPNPTPHANPNLANPDPNSHAHPNLAPLGPIPRDDDGPVFAEPWQAVAFAIAVALSREERFTWNEWTAALSQEIADAQCHGDPDLGDTYYLHWTRALERLCADKQLALQPEIARRANEWRRAYLRTPHGQPIELNPAPPHP